MTSPILTTIGELISQNQGSIKTGPFGTTLKASEYSLTGVPVISVGEVDYGQLRLRSETPRVDINVTDRLPEYLLKLGDIVFGRKGAVDRSAWVKPDESGWFLGSDGLRLRLPPSVDSKYIAYQLQMPATRAWLLQHAAGSTLLSLNQGTLARVPIVLFPLVVQRAIAEVLGALDDKIAANTMITTTLTELRQYSYLQLPKRSEQPISQLLTRMKIGRKIIKNELLADGDWPVYDQSALGELGFLNGPGAIEATDAKPVLYFGDHTCTLRLSSESFFVGPNTIPFIGRNVSTLVLLCALSGVQQHVEYKRHWSDLLSKSVALPDDVACTQFEKVWRDSLALERSMREECRTLAELRDTLLPQLMSGKLRVKDAETAVEEVL